MKSVAGSPWMITACVVLASGCGSPDPVRPGAEGGGMAGGAPPSSGGTAGQGGEPSTSSSGTGGNGAGASGATGAGGGNTSSGGNAGGSSSSVCGNLFDGGTKGACEACLEDSFCAELIACSDDPNCVACVTSSDAPCDVKSGAVVALLACGSPDDLTGCYDTEACNPPPGNLLDPPACGATVPALKASPSNGSCVTIDNQVVQCNPVTAEKCAVDAGESCDVRPGGGFQCWGDKNTQAKCAPCGGADNFCQAGFTCLEARCIRYCCSDADCGNGASCTTKLLDGETSLFGTAAPGVGVCVEVP